MAGFIICLITSGCSGAADGARREYVVVSGVDAVYALDAVSGALYELGSDESGMGWYREIKYERIPGAHFLPVADTRDDGSVHFIGTDNGRLFDIDFSRNADSVGVAPSEIAPRDGESVIAVDEDDYIIRSDKGLRFTGGGYEIPKPDGDFVMPVAAKDYLGEWVVVWPERIVIPKDPDEWRKIAMVGAGPTGQFTVQVISDGYVLDEYRISNPTYHETHATGLIAALVDADDNLLLLDDKGYVTVYFEGKIVNNFFAGISPSRYAVNSASPGPSGNILVTNAVNRVVNLYNPTDGSVAYSWRLPAERAGISSKAKIFMCSVDIVMLVLIVMLIVRLNSRLKRYREYRKGDGVS